MRFHPIAFCTILGLISAGASLAGEPADAERRFAEQLDQQVEMQLSALVSQNLAAELEAIHVPSAMPPVKLDGRPSTPVASATSARALPEGELTATRLDCHAAAGDVACTVAPGAAVTSLATRTR